VPPSSTLLRYAGPGRDGRSQPPPRSLRLAPGCGASKSDHPPWRPRRYSRSPRSNARLGLVRQEMNKREQAALLVRLFSGRREAGPICRRSRRIREQEAQDCEQQRASRLAVFSRAASSGCSRSRSLLRHRRHLHPPWRPALGGRGVGRGGHVSVAWGDPSRPAPCWAHPRRAASRATRSACRERTWRSRYTSQCTGWPCSEVAAGALRARSLGKSGLWRTWGLACLDQALPPAPLRAHARLRLERLPRALAA
jgi:hypothetical protein